MSKGDTAADFVARLVLFAVVLGVSVTAIPDRRVQVFIGGPDSPYLDWSTQLKIVVLVAVGIVYAAVTAGVAWVHSSGPVIRFSPEREEWIGRDPEQRGVSFRISVHNSGGDVLENAVVKLIEIAPPPEEGPRLEMMFPLAESQGFSSSPVGAFMLRPGETRRLNAFTHTRLPSGNDSLCAFSVHGDGSLPRILPTASYDLEIALYGTNIKRPFRQRARIEIADRTATFTLVSRWTYWIGWGRRI